MSSCVLGARYVSTSRMDVRSATHTPSGNSCACKRTKRHSKSVRASLDVVSQRQRQSSQFLCTFCFLATDHCVGAPGQLPRQQLVAMAGANTKMSNLSFRSRVSNSKCLVRPRARVCARSQRLNVQAVRPASGILTRQQPVIETPGCSSCASTGRSGLVTCTNQLPIHQQSNTTAGYTHARWRCNGANTSRPSIIPI